MAITAGNDILASDFINESERNATKTNDVGRVPKLESDGYLQPSFIRDVSARVTLAGNYTTPASGSYFLLPFDTEDYDTHAMHTTGTGNVYNETTVDSEWYIDDTSADGYDQQKMSQVVVGSTARVVTSFTFEGRYIGGTTSNDQVYFEIRSGSETGTLLATSTTATITSSGFASYTVYFPPTLLSASTTYYLIARHVGDRVALRARASGGATSKGYNGSVWSSIAEAVSGQLGYVAGGVFTVPTGQAGKYLVIFNVASNYDVDTLLRIHKNNTVVAGGGINDRTNHISTILSLAVGDVIYGSYQRSATTSGDVLAQGSSFEIIRLR